MKAIREIHVHTCDTDQAAYIKGTDQTTRCVLVVQHVFGLCG